MSQLSLWFSIMEQSSQSSVSSVSSVSAVLPSPHRPIDFLFSPELRPVSFAGLQTDVGADLALTASFPEIHPLFLSDH